VIGTTLLTRTEKILLAIPMLAGFVFGLFPLLAPAAFAAISGFPGNDEYIYRLAGAATLGYGVGLAAALRRGDWVGARLPVAAVLTFNLGSLFACVLEILRPGGQAGPIVYLILAASLFFVALSATLLYRHGADRPGPPDIAPWVRVFVLIATVLAAATGFVALFAPHLLQLFGLQGTDPFIFRQAGAATFGYAITGIMELRSRNWADMRCAILMAAVFNGFSLVASVVSLISGDPVFLPVLFGVSTLGVTVAAIVALRTDGGTRTAASR
jgi:hypothetical protein